MRGRDDDRAAAARRAVAELMKNGRGLRPEDVSPELRRRLVGVALSEAEIEVYARQVRRELARRGR